MECYKTSWRVVNQCLLWYHHILKPIFFFFSTDFILCKLSFFTSPNTKCKILIFFFLYFSENFLKLYNFFGFLMDHFTPASSESKTACCEPLLKSQNSVMLVFMKEKKICWYFPLFLYLRKPDLSHLPQEWNVWWCRLGEVLLLWKRRGAGQLQRPPSDLPHDFLWRVQAGRGLQAQTCECAHTQDWRRTATSAVFVVCCLA